MIGAKCRLVSGGKVMHTLTDEYGDFWFTDLAVGLYELTIEAKDYEIKVFKDIRTRECVNLGDIPLQRK